MSLNEIITNSATESYIGVMESYLQLIDKYESINESDSTFFQESESMKERFRPVDENGNKEKLIWSILWAIPRFLKMIWDAIAKFFKKTKDTVIDKLKKLLKKDQKECDEIQDNIDNNTDGCKDDMAKLEQKNIEDQALIVDDSMVEGTVKKKDIKEGTTLFYRPKAIKTRILFDKWNDFFDDIERYFKELTSENSAPRLVTKFKSKPDGTIDVKNPNIIYRLTHHQSKIKFFRASPKDVLLKDYVTDAEKATDKLNKLSDMAKDVSETFKEVEKVIKEDPEVTNGVFKTIARINNDILTIYKVLDTLLQYLNNELSLIGNYMVIVEQVKLTKQNKANKKAEEEAEEKKSDADDAEKEAEEKKEEAEEAEDEAEEAKEEAEEAEDEAEDAKEEAEESSVSEYATISNYWYSK